MLIQNEMKQQLRKLKAGNADDARAAEDNRRALLAAADGWADANGLERLRRAEEQQRLTNLQIRTGLQMITDGTRKYNDMLTEEMHVSRRAQG